jgi:hypothetical protein
MIGLRKTLGMRGSATIQAASRGFAGGGSKPMNIDPKTTDFDIVFVGKQIFFLTTEIHALTTLLDVCDVTA